MNKLLSPRISIKELFSRYGVLIAFILLFAISASRQGEFFLKPDNLRNIVNQNVPVGIIAVGMTFVIITGGIDLAGGSLVALVGALGLVFMNKQIDSRMSEGMAAILGSGLIVALGALGGLVQGIFIAFGRITPFVATLVGMVAFRSMTVVLANGGEVRSLSKNVWPDVGIGGIPVPFVKDTQGNPIVIYYGIIAFIVVVMVGSFILNKTRYGRYAIAVGANERASHYSAVPVNRVKLLTYMLSGICVGIAAVFLSGKMNSVASGSQGVNFELDAIAAVVIGGTSLKGGYGRIWGTVIGVLLMGIITNMLVFENINSHWQGVVKGVVILLAVLLQRERRDV
ncbi:MAG: ABC transporter permease [Fimbriimonadaceae bacterium]